MNTLKLIFISVGLATLLILPFLFSTLHCSTTAHRSVFGDCSDW